MTRQTSPEKLVFPERNPFQICLDCPPKITNALEGGMDLRIKDKQSDK